MAIAGSYNIIADQGATFQRTLTYYDSTGAPVNLSGYSAKMQVRQVPQSTDVLLELSTTNGRITLGGSAGTISLNVAAADMGFAAATYVYDLEVTSGANVVTRIVMGTFQLRAEVTR